jgi:hypothetical protein
MILRKCVGRIRLAHDEDQWGALVDQGTSYFVRLILEKKSHVFKYSRTWL